MDRAKFVEGVKGERKKNVRNGEIANAVLESHKSSLNANVTQYIKQVFLSMLELYNEREKSFALNMLQPIYDDALNKLEQERGLNKALSLLEQVYEYDYDIHNSSAQAKRNARGYFLECVLDSLFENYAKGQFLRQVKIAHEGVGKRIDFVVGATSIFDPIENPLYITVKKSLRERGSQVSDEKIFLDTNLLFFFYADLKRLSDGVMTKLYNEDIVMVTYGDAVTKYYSDRKNVISYDKFFLEMLPAYLTNKNDFKAVNHGIETLNQKNIIPHYTLRRAQNA